MNLFGFVKTNGIQKSLGYLLLIAALSAVVFSPVSSARAEDTPTTHYEVAIDEFGNAKLTLVDQLDSSSRGDSILGNTGIEEQTGRNTVENSGLNQFNDYLVTGSNGQTAVIRVPAGTAPAIWTNPENTFGIAGVTSSYLETSFGNEARMKAQEYLRLMAEAAYAEYCGTSIRPSEFTIEISIGANFVVNGNAKVSAKFISSEICNN